MLLSHQAQFALVSEVLDGVARPLSLPLKRYCMSRASRDDDAFPFLPTAVSTPNPNMQVLELLIKHWGRAVKGSSLQLPCLAFHHLAKGSS